MIKATKEFKFYRNMALGLSNKDYRSLQVGKSIKVDDKIVKKYPQCFEQIKAVKDGTR